jgi:hypothetical protein
LLSSPCAYARVAFIIVELSVDISVTFPSCANATTNAVVDIPAAAIKANPRIDEITIVE